MSMGLASPTKLRSKTLGNSSMSANLPTYSHILASSAQGDHSQSASQGTLGTKYRAASLSAPTITRAGHIVCIAPVDRLMRGHSRSLDNTAVDFSTPLHDLGVNSLMAVELRAWFAKEF